MEEIMAVRSNLSTFGSKRVNMMLGFGERKTGETPEEIDLMRHSRYGLGTKRTLEQAEKFTGINFKKERMDVNGCGNMKWVPYEESQNYGVAELLSRGHAGEEVRPYVVTPDNSHSILQAQSIDRELLGAGTTDYNLIGGLLLAFFAIVIRLLTGKKEKAASHKE